MIQQFPHSQPTSLAFGESSPSSPCLPRILDQDLISPTRQRPDARTRTQMTEMTQIARHLFTCKLHFQPNVQQILPPQQDHWTSLEFQVPSCHSSDSETHLACIVEVAHLIAIIGNQMEQVEGLIAGIHPDIGLTYKSSFCGCSHPIRPFWPPKPSQAHCS